MSSQSTGNTNHIDGNLTIEKLTICFARQYEANLLQTTPQKFKNLRILVI